MCPGGRRQMSRTYGRFQKPKPACRRKPTICSALRRFLVRKPFSAPLGARGLSRKTWIRILGRGSRLVSAVLSEISDDWQTERSYLNMEAC
jgi:hypothetical protein